MNSQLIGPVTAARPNDETTPREPPPPPTVLDFPSCAPKRQGNKQEQLDVVKLLGNLVRTGPKLTHLEAFNVILDNNVTLEDFIPAATLPPASWLADSAVAGSSNVSTTPPQEPILSNGRPAPSSKVFHNTAQELLHDNGDAFRAARRQSPLPNRPAPRIVHSRKFWNALADVATYWDTSLDNFTEEEITEKENEFMDVDQPHSKEQESVKMNVDDSKADDEEHGNTAKKTKTTYTGRRTDTGRNMPRKYREDLVSAFVEMLAWAFSCRLEQATMQPKLHLHGVTFPLPHIASVYRTPRDASSARSGILEGPLLAVSSRDQTRFRNPDQNEGEGPFEIMDFLRETGLMAMVAQKRAREGTKEVQAGAGKWWTTKPRWGGGPGGECGIAEEEPIEEPPVQEGNGPQRKRAKRSTKADVWRAMQPPRSTWEKGVRYQQVGKKKGDDFDDIYLISSLNHHISLLHLRIHDNYTAYLNHTPKPNSSPSNQPNLNPTNTKTPTLNPPQEPSPHQQPWFELPMQRSKWFDMLNADDRVQAMRGVWGILGFLMRDVSVKEKERSDPFV